MQIFDEITALRTYLSSCKKSGRSVGLVPTMGALHEGHISLIKASKLQNQVTVCSLFVNPTQFNNPRDLEKYPRTFESDRIILEQSGCDVLFAPTTTMMYDKPSTIRFDFGSLDKILEGEFRPGHFSGVALVVSKLFNIVEPDHAYFGQKDFQQFAIIRKLVEELKFGLQLHCMPIIRESDGLAMSSRNMRLNAIERQRAIILYQQLISARQDLRHGKSWKDIQQAAIRQLGTKEGVRLEYFELADRHDLANHEGIGVENGILLMACYVGEIRLIDNLIVAED